MNNEIYKKKYLKYKTKNQKEIKIFDLDEEHDYKKYNLQNNLKLFEKKYGKIFKVKWNDILIDVRLNKIKLPSTVMYYRMVYDIPDRTYELIPFSIDFIDMTKAELNNNSYISSIHKTENISGTNMVKICLKINEILGVKKTVLGDGAMIKCNITGEELGLSFIKFLEKEKTYYMNLGFDFEMTGDEFFYFRYRNRKNFLKAVQKSLRKIKIIKTSDIFEEYEKILLLVTKAMKENFKETFFIKIGRTNPTKDNEFYAENPKNKIDDLYLECKNVLRILNENKEEKFYKLLIHLFKNKCDDYSLLNKYVMENEKIEIGYGKEKIRRDYIKNFALLTMYIHYYSYSYTF